MKWTKLFRALSRDDERAHMEAMHSASNTIVSIANERDRIDEERFQLVDACEHLAAERDDLRDTAEAFRAALNAERETLRRLRARVRAWCDATQGLDVLRSYVDARDDAGSPPSPTACADVRRGDGGSIFAGNDAGNVPAPTDSTDLPRPENPPVGAVGGSTNWREDYTYIAEYVGAAHHADGHPVIPGTVVEVRNAIDQWIGEASEARTVQRRLESQRVWQAWQSLAYIAALQAFTDDLGAAHKRIRELEAELAALAKEAIHQHARDETRCSELEAELAKRDAQPEPTDDECYAVLGPLTLRGTCPCAKCKASEATPKPTAGDPDAKPDWHQVGDGAFARPFGTVRACIDCSVLISGGPTRCMYCASRDEQPEPTAESGNLTSAAAVYVREVAANDPLAPRTYGDLAWSLDDIDPERATRVNRDLARHVRDLQESLQTTRDELERRADQAGNFLNSLNAERAAHEQTRATMAATYERERLMHRDANDRLEQTRAELAEWMKLGELADPQPKDPHWRVTPQHIRSWLTNYELRSDSLQSRLDQSRAELERQTERAEAYAARVGQAVTGLERQRDQAKAELQRLRDGVRDALNTPTSRHQLMGAHTLLQSKLRALIGDTADANGSMGT